MLPKTPPFSFSEILLGRYRAFMNVLRIACCFGVALAFLQDTYAQGFLNLDFEQSTIVSSYPSGFDFNYGIANVSGWTEYNSPGGVNYSGGMTLGYNSLPLDAQIGRAHV